VRLTEKFVADASRPFLPEAEEKIAAHTRLLLAQSDFRFALPPGTPAVGTGGTVSTVRAITAARAGRNFDDTDSLVTVAALRDLLAYLGPLPPLERRKIPGLPPARADVFPTALATLLAVADAGGLTAFRHSLYNLRFGLAADELAKLD
jgi:exopolyphosphatase/guanosine-5'-triphosphate,3'-diphosphate pyrophosphatase